MSLDRMEAAEALKDILALYTMNDQQRIDYAESIMEACGWMRGERFARVCKELLREIPPNGRKPVPSQYVAIYRKLEDREGWSKQEFKKCSGCNGDGLVRAFIRGRASGRVYTAVKPCPICNHRQYETPMTALADEITEQEFLDTLAAQREEDKKRIIVVQSVKPAATNHNEALRKRVEEARARMLKDFKQQAKPDTLAPVLPAPPPLPAREPGDDVEELIDMGEGETGEEKELA